METPAATKSALRRRLRDARSGLPRDVARRAAAAVADRLLALPEVAGARRVFSCLSFGDELDTRRLIDRLLAGGREVYVPRTLSVERRLALHRFPCPLVPLKMGLDEPRRDSPALDEAEIDSTIDVALVLGVAFDRDGFRLGYGAGYFDRFLAGRPFPAIGLAYELQVVAALPREPHDVPMTVVVSETSVRRPTRRAGLRG